MFKKEFIKLIFCLAAAFFLLSTSIDAACNVCSEFGIACINENSFNLCERGQPKTNRAFPCPNNKQCSDTEKKCVDKVENVTATCDLNVQSCGVCDGNKMFSCTSRTTYIQCDGTTPTTIKGSCSSGLICDSRGGELCKNECTRPAQLECDIESPL